MKIRKIVKTGELFFKDEIMEKRPAIPEPLKKRVLEEAGHRCEIPTCRISPPNSYRYYM